MAQYALGLDLGTSSVRALLVDCATGDEIGTGVASYPSGEEGVVLDPANHFVARQNPADYPSAIQSAIKDATAQGAQNGFTNHDLVGIGIDTTGSSPIPLAKDGMPLSMTECFKGELAAMTWLWKDHSSYEEASEITQKAKQQGRPYLAKCGGAYSSEWLWSKILHCARTSPKVFEAAHTWMELCDFIPSRMTKHAVDVSRGVCAAGHKGMYSREWGGLPDKEFLSSLDPRLADLRDRMYDKAFSSDHKAGELSDQHSKFFGLKEGTPVAVGILDAHAGAVGSGVKPGRMVKIIGTSTCDILVGSHVDDIVGVSGVVDGSVLPGLTGIEAGQAAVGDIFAWWSRVCGISQEKLSVEAAKQKPGQHGLIALDWNNGNRNILMDPLLTGLLVGQTLNTTAPEIYRALIEATAFGALKIIRQIERHGVQIDEMVACGGIAEKNSLLMQIYADILNRPIKLSRSAQAPALGAAIFGAVVGGAHPNVQTAQAHMTGFKSTVYQPESKAAEIYQRLFRVYERLHDGFGVAEQRSVMKDLLSIKGSASR